MNLINSANRTAAKRLLVALGNDSRIVRMQSLQELNDSLARAMNQGLITRQGAERALGFKVDTQARGTEDKGSKPATSTTAERDERDAETSTADDDRGDAGNGDSANADANAADADGDGNASADADGDGADADANADADSNADDADANGDSNADASDKEAEAETGDDAQSESDSENAEEKNAEEETAEQESDEEESGEEESKEENSDAPNAEEKTEEENAEEEKNDDGTLRHEMFNVVMKWIESGANVALVGPAGSGKSTIVQHVCAHLGREFRGCGQLLNKFELIGFRDANGNYHETALYDAYVNGYVFCFDEMDASAPDAVVAFNGITDNQPVYAFPNGMQKKHPDFVAVCAMNTWGNGATTDYVGRTKQDAASMSRFVKIYVDYDRRIEAAIAGAKHVDIAQRVWDLRQACNELAIKHVVSTRMIVQAVQGRKAKCTKREIDRDVFFAGLDEHAIKQVKAKMKNIAANRGETVSED